MADRDEVQHRAVTEVRIAHIAAMMRACEWRTGKSGPPLAELWGLGIDRVEQLSAEASKRVKAEVMDPERVGASIGTRLQKIVETGDDRDAINAARVWAEVSGATAPQKIEHSGSLGADPAEVARRVAAFRAARATGGPGGTGGVSGDPSGGGEGGDPGDGCGG